MTACCVAEAFDLALLKRGLLSAPWAGASLKVDTDCLLVPILSASNARLGDAFVFSYGTVGCWGLSADEEQRVVSALLSCPGVTGAMSPRLREGDQFVVAFSQHMPLPGEKSRGLSTIKDGTVFLDDRCRKDEEAKLAIMHAISQSTKLVSRLACFVRSSATTLILCTSQAVFETRVTALAEQSSPLPLALAAQGTVKMPRKVVARFVGQLFLQRSSVNLLSSVLDTPSFLWDTADELQSLYSSLSKYLELRARISVLNSRYEVLESMLLMVQQQLTDSHATRLEWVIIWLITAEIGLGCAELWLLRGGAH